jgi:hypothetical protein
MHILALDIGKFNTVYCDYICESGEHECGKVKTASWYAALRGSDTKKSRRP